MMAKHPVLDGHNDLPWQLRIREIDPDLRTDLSATGLHTDFARLRQGGVAGQFWSVYVPSARGAARGQAESAGDASSEAANEAQATVAVLEQIDLVRRLAARYPDELTLVTSADEAEKARAAGRVASLLGAEGGHCIAGSLGVLRMLYALGVRYMTLTHSANNAWADSATDKPVLGGLSPFGHDVVREMNRLGMLVDLAHVAPATMHAALDTSLAPAFFSHSSARAVCDHPRNVPDDVLTRVKDTNGVVMVTFVPFFLNEQCRAWGNAMYAFEATIEAPTGTPEFQELMDAWLAANPCPPSTVADAADHVEHVRDVAGVDAVGLGGDYDGTPALPEGLGDVARYPALFDELGRRGWSAGDLDKLGWHNAVRVLRDTEAAASRASAG
jgi:membrane dipeptidase